MCRPGDPEDPLLTANVPFDHARGQEVISLEPLRGVLVPDVQKDSLAEFDTQSVELLQRRWQIEVDEVTSAAVEVDPNRWWTVRRNPPSIHSTIVPPDQVVTLARPASWRRALRLASCGSIATTRRASSPKRSRRSPNGT